MSICENLHKSRKSSNSHQKESQQILTNSLKILWKCSFSQNPDEILHKFHKVSRISQISTFSEEILRNFSNLQILTRNSHKFAQEFVKMRATDESRKYCNTLQHTVTYCNTLQRTATHCNALQHSATQCNTLQQTVTYCNTLQHTATHCNPRQHTATHCNALQQETPRSSRDFAY